MTTIPTGYHQALASAIAVVLAFSLGFLLFWTIQPNSGDWTRLGAIATIPLVLGTVLQFVALYRALSVQDDHVAHYNLTVRWFFGGVYWLHLRWFGVASQWRSDVVHNHSNSHTAERVLLPRDVRPSLGYFSAHYCVDLRLAHAVDCARRNPLGQIIEEGSSSEQKPQGRTTRW